MKLLVCRLFLVGVLLPAGFVWAGVISPALQIQMDSLPAGEALTVLVVMKDQADIRSLDENLHASKSAMSTRHLAVVVALKDVAEQTQTDLLASLRLDKSSGMVLGYTPHWLINAVVVRGQAEAIAGLARRSDVASIEPNLVVELIGPVPGSRVDKDASRGLGLVPGVEAIKAPLVWQGLGVTGEGALIGVLDTGADGSHPALAGSWRGNNAPAEECWLDAANLGDSDFPADRHFHGTHVTGTTVGLAEGDTIGVAPGAQWIASNGINAELGDLLDNSVLASLEWFTDPDGDPATLDDVPDVVQNSWGVNESFSGYLDCDSRWWDAIDNCEAAGVALIFSAGNEGPGSQTLRSPADRATTPYNCFSVGSTSAFYPYSLSSFSSRGPSGSDCGPQEFLIKPEVCAPGSDIYSARPGGGFQYLSGTSMAGPHVTGVVALMRSANPNIDVTTIKQVLMESALDLGFMGEDNQYGHGFIDAYAAVISVIDGIGYALGRITDATTGQPIVGAVVSMAGGYQTAETDVAGLYQLTLPVGTRELNVQQFGYRDGTISAEILDNETTYIDKTLNPLGKSNLSGLVLDASGAPVPGATLRFLNAPLPPIEANGAGFYSVDLPEMFAYEIVAESEELGPDTQEIPLYWTTVFDFHLSVLDRDGFESGDFSANSWLHGGQDAWVVSGMEPYGGSFAAQSGPIDDDDRSTLSVERHIAADGMLSFAVRTSTELGYDHLILTVDGLELGRWSGQEPWQTVNFPIRAGTHLFTWTFAKDPSVSNFDDKVWIDNVTFPNNGVPVLSLSHDALALVSVPGASGLKHLILTNDGPSNLRFGLGLRDGSDPQPVSLKVFSDFSKGETDPRSSKSPVLGSGGPDGSGYNWIDNENPGGPTFQWVELQGVGTVAGSGDDANLGPFPLGFTFPFYGVEYDSLRVCTNGWASFTSTSQAYANQGIPTLAEPNNLLSPFWTDLNPDAAGSILYHFDIEHNRFIVQWDEVPHYDSEITETFQMILNQDGSILYQYKDVGFGGTCTVGLENGGGNDGLQVVFNSPYLENGRVILFTTHPPVSWLSVAPSMGEIAPGGKAQLDVAFSGVNLPEGTYEAAIILNTNDPSAEEVIIPVVLTLGGTTGIPDELPVAGAVLLGAVPNPFNPATEIRFILPEAVAVELILYDVSGRHVKTLVHGLCPAGDNAIPWRGNDEKGRSVSSGTYFAQLRGPGISLVKPVVLIR